MIAHYFFTRFMLAAGMYFSLLLALFLSCNMILKLPLITHPGILPHLMILLFPVMTLFALPLATSLAVQVTIAEHKQRDELVLLAFLSRAMASLRIAGLFFSVLMMVVYALCSFYLAPRGYVLSKQLLFSLAKDQLLHVEPKKFHSPAPMLSFYVHEKETHPDTGIIFKKIMLLVSPSKTERLFFMAERGFFQDNQLVLIDGYSIAYKGNAAHTVFFQKTALYLDAYIQQSNEKKIFFSSRFLTMPELCQALQTKKSDVFFEFHKRIAQTLWQLVLIFLAFAYALSRPAGSFLHTLVACGTMFLATYLLIMLAQAYQHVVVLCLLLLYFPLLLAMVASLWVIFSRRYSLCS
jgi:lipopolysaccharide export LptBFGC system permease protein LptF